MPAVPSALELARIPDFSNSTNRGFEYNRKSIIEEKLVSLYNKSAGLAKNMPALRHTPPFRYVSHSMPFSCPKDINKMLSHRF